MVHLESNGRTSWKVMVHLESNGHTSWKVMEHLESNGHTSWKVMEHLESNGTSVSPNLKGSIDLLVAYHFFVIYTLTHCCLLITFVVFIILTLHGPFLEASGPTHSS